MPKKSEKCLLCECGEPQGKEVGNWIEYPNPTICQKCGKDNTEAVKNHIIGAV